MNGRYTLTQTPGGNDTLQRFPMQFREYPGGVGFFEVYSLPITTLYSQVYLKSQPPVDIPREVVEHFRGKGMAIIGMEADQVRRTDKGDLSIPINALYNHHYDIHVIGKHAAFEQVSASDPSLHSEKGRMSSMGHGVPTDGMFVVKDLGTSDGELPISQQITCSNGGEYRKSFRGIAPGYAQVLDSPTQVQITPMMIDTWHREKMDLDEVPSRFVAGPLPQAAQAPPGAPYSGLLECPLTTRWRKEIQGGYATQSAGRCANPIATAQECYTAAEAEFGPAGATFNFSSSSDAAHPRGCSVAADPRAPGRVLVRFRAEEGGVDCGQGTVRLIGTVSSLVRLEVQVDPFVGLVTLNLTGPSDVWFGVGFNATTMGEAPWTVIVEGSGKVSERQLAKDAAGSFSGAHDPGHQLVPSLVLKQSVEEGGRRTVTLTRPLQGRTVEYFSFGAGSPPLLNFINAVGGTSAFGVHKQMTASSIVLLPTSGGAAAPLTPPLPGMPAPTLLRWLRSTTGEAAGVCLCAKEGVPFGGARGVLEYVKTSQPEDKGSAKFPFGNHCGLPPYTDLLVQRNPTCDVRTYKGGAQACPNGVALLDADQMIPWPDQPLTFFMKYRFWFQEYNASYHQNVNYNGQWMIAAPIEYDVPKCGVDVPGCSQWSDGTWVHTVTGTIPSNTHGTLVEGHFHCHAATCLVFELYMCPPGTRVCDAATGRLLCRQEPIYGGQGRVEPKWDEPGYILMPPCKWGSAEYGLEEPPDVTGQMLGIVKVANATVGHTGEMVAGQVLIRPTKDPVFI